jgi:signal transduction histidine kinase
VPAGEIEYLRVATASGEALPDLLNEVLDFAKIGAGQLQQAHEPIDVQAIVESVMTLFSALTPTRRSHRAAWAIRCTCARC